MTEVRQDDPRQSWLYQNAKQVRVLLALRGWGQNDLASALGVSASHLSRAIKGERRLSDEHQRKLIAVLVDGNEMGVDR